MSDCLVYIEIVVHPLPVSILHNLQLISLRRKSHQVSHVAVYERQIPAWLRTVKTYMCDMTV